MKTQPPKPRALRREDRRSETEPAGSEAAQRPEAPAATDQAALNGNAVAVRAKGRSASDNGTGENVGGPSIIGNAAGARARRRSKGAGGGAITPAARMNGAGPAHGPAVEQRSATGDALGGGATEAPTQEAAGAPDDVAVAPSMRETPPADEAGALETEAETETETGAPARTAESEARAPSESEASQPPSPARSAPEAESEAKAEPEKPATAAPSGKAPAPAALTGAEGEEKEGAEDTKKEDAKTEAPAAGEAAAATEAEGASKEEAAKGQADEAKQAAEDAGPAAGGEGAPAEQAAAGGGGAPAGAGGDGPQPEAADPEAEAEALEQKMAEAAPEADAAAEGEASEETPAAEPLDAALATSRAPDMEPEAPDTPEVDALERAEDDLDRREEDVEPVAARASARATEASEGAAPPATSVDQPSATVLAASATRPEPAAPTPAVEQTEPESEPTGEADLSEIDAASAEGPASEAEGASEELSPAERDVAMASLQEEQGPEPAASGGGGASAGVGGASAAPAEPPDVSGMEPESAMGAVASLPPVALAAGLGGVTGAVSTSVGKKRDDLAANPPQMERPSGAPQTKSGAGGAQDGAPAGKDGKAVEKSEEGAEKPTPEPEPLPEPPPSPAESVAQPAVSGTPEGEMSEGDVARLSGSVDSLPTTDPALHVKAGAPPTVALEGNADPQKTADQKAKLDQTITDTQTEGRKDAGQYMGEDEIFPVVPAETLKAKVESGGGGGGGGGPPAAGAAGADAETLSIVAKEEKGGEIQSAVAQARGDMAAKRQGHEQKVSDEEQKNSEAIAELESENTSQQTKARQAAKDEVQAHRGKWGDEQQKLVDDSNKKADTAVTDATTKIESEQASADKRAATEITHGDQKAAEARTKGEGDARKEKAKAQEKKSGFFGWLASKATAFFNGIKAGIKKAFELARKAVKAAIELAKKAAAAIIEAARKAIVLAIKVVGAALIALGDVVLAGFPGLRDKWRAAVKKTVDAAEKAVNELAEALKEGINKLLDLLGKAINGLLNLYEKALLAAVDIAAKVVDGAIKFAKSVVDALAVFAVLIKDVAAAPGQWISNLGAAVVDGIKNDLWREFKAAVKGWFNAKLQGIIGLGAAVWGLLKSGGIGLAKIGEMAWGAVKAMIPPTLIQILVEKLVAMVVPAAGAVMVIIEGLRAAWGSISQIIQAFGRFMDFLKAIKGGGAGPKFAAALAAAAIVVIDFVANWLLLKIGKGLKKLGGKLKGIAKRLGKKRKGKKAKGKKKKKGKDKKKAGTGPGGRPRAPKARRPRKPGGKPKGGSRHRKKKKDKDAKKKKKEAKKRLRKAKAAIKSQLRPGKKEGAARGIIARIAGRYKVQQTFSRSKKGWKLRLRANPSLKAYFTEADTDAGVKASIKAAGVSQRTVLKALKAMRAQLVASAQEDAAGDKQTEMSSGQANKLARAELAEKGGLAEWIKTTDIDKSVGGATSGPAWQQVVAAQLKARAEAQGKIFVGEVHPEGQTSGGFDATIIDPVTGETEVFEIKRGALQTLEQTSSEKKYTPGATDFPLDPKAPPPSDPREKSTEVSRHLDANERDADRIARGETMTKEHKGKTVPFENKLSAITANFERNILAVENALDRAIKQARKADDQGRVSALQRAHQHVQNIRTQKSGELKRVILLKEGASASSSQRKAAQRILDASASAIGKEDIKSIIRRTRDDGSEIVDSDEAVFGPVT